MAILLKFPKNNRFKLKKFQTGGVPVYADFDVRLSQVQAGASPFDVMQKYEAMRVQRQRAANAGRRTGSTKKPELKLEKLPEGDLLNNDRREYEKRKRDLLSELRIEHNKNSNSPRVFELMDEFDKLPEFHYRAQERKKVWDAINEKKNKKDNEISEDDFIYKEGDDGNGYGIVWAKVNNPSDEESSYKWVNLEDLNNTETVINDDGEKEVKEKYKAINVGAALNYLNNADWLSQSNPDAMGVLNAIEGSIGGDLLDGLITEKFKNALGNVKKSESIVKDEKGGWKLEGKNESSNINALNAVFNTVTGTMDKAKTNALRTKAFNEVRNNPTSDTRQGLVNNIDKWTSDYLQNKLIAQFDIDEGNAENIKNKWKDELNIGGNEESKTVKNVHPILAEKEVVGNLKPDGTLTYTLVKDPVTVNNELISFEGVTGKDQVLSIKTKSLGQHEKIIKHANQKDPVKRYNLTNINDMENKEGQGLADIIQINTASFISSGDKVNSKKMPTPVVFRPPGSLNNTKLDNINQIFVLKGNMRMATVLNKNEKNYPAAVIEKHKRIMDEQYNKEITPLLKNIENLEEEIKSLDPKEDKKKIKLLNLQKDELVIKGINGMKKISDENKLEGVEFETKILLDFSYDHEIIDDIQDKFNSYTTEFKGLDPTKNNKYFKDLNQDEFYKELKKTKGNLTAGQVLREAKNSLNTKPKKPTKPKNMTPSEEAEWVKKEAEWVKKEKVRIEKANATIEKVIKAFKSHMDESVIFDDWTTQGTQYKNSDLYAWLNNVKRNTPNYGVETSDTTLNREYDGTGNDKKVTRWGSTDAVLGSLDQNNIEDDEGQSPDWQKTITFAFDQQLTKITAATLKNYYTSVTNLKDGMLKDVESEEFNSSYVFREKYANLLQHLTLIQNTKKEIAQK